MYEVYYDWSDTVQSTFLYYFRCTRFSEFWHLTKHVSDIYLLKQNNLKLKDTESKKITEAFQAAQVIAILKEDRL